MCLNIANPVDTLQREVSNTKRMWKIKSDLIVKLYFFFFLFSNYSTLSLFTCFAGTVSNNPFKWSALIDFDYMWVNFYSWFIATFTRGELAEVLNVWALFEVIEDYTLLVLGNIFNFNRLTYTQAENIKYFVICVLFFALFF
jgi:hypothetical protein